MASNKLNFAVNWLATHPDDVYLGGRALESKVRYSEFQTITYRTWNEAKRLLRISTFGDTTGALSEPMPPRKLVIIDYKNREIRTQWGTLTSSWQMDNLKALTSDKLIELYESAGYRMSFSSAQLIRMEKVTPKGRTA